MVCISAPDDFLQGLYLPLEEALPTFGLDHASLWTRHCLPLEVLANTPQGGIAHAVNCQKNSCFRETYVISGLASRDCGDDRAVIVRHRQPMWMAAVGSC